MLYPIEIYVLDSWQSGYILRSVALNQRQPRKERHNAKASQYLPQTAFTIKPCKASGLSQQAHDGRVLADAFGNGFLARQRFQALSPADSAPIARYGLVSAHTLR